MSKLLKYLKGSIPWILVIFGFLSIQAYSELALPTYTSNIVNVGIQQSGVETAVPDRIRQTELDKLLLFVPEEDKDAVSNAYQQDTKHEGQLQLKSGVAEDEEKVAELTQILSRPEMIVTGFSSDSDQTKAMKEQIMGNVPAGGVPKGSDIFDVLVMMPPEQLNAMVDKMNEQFDEMPDSIIEQAGTAFVKTEYKAIGIDTDRMQNQYILQTGLKMIGLAFLSMAASIMVGFLAARVGASVSKTLRKRVFTKVVDFSNNEFDQFSTASLITRSTNDIQQIQMLITMMLRMVLYAPLIGIGGVFKVFSTNSNMSWIIGLAVALILILVAFLFAIVMPKFKVVQKLVDKLNLVTREILTGLQVIRAFSTEKHEEERFDQANTDLTKMNLFVNRAMTFMMPIMMLIMNGITVLIVWVGAHGVDAGNMQVGDMMAFIQYAMQIIMAFLMLCMMSIMIPRASVSAVRVDEVLTSKTTIKDPQAAKQLPADKKGLLEFKHVCFRYPGADEDVLHDIDFTAKPGETTAIIGSTGSGKTTLVTLIPRFYDVTEGQITIDGVDIRYITQHELRNELGYVPQKGVLFSGTIASNIKFSDENISFEKMEEATAIAQATEFVEQKDATYDSYIAQGGANVSGGQKQRLSIARAIAKEPNIFIFDDSFSALDYKTDVALRKALKEKTADSTVLIVAQRISTILQAEQIIVLDEGMIAGKGTHLELMKSCEVYQQIAQSQLSEAELKEYEDGKEEA